MRSTQSTVAHTLVASLRAHGVDRIFCVAGESFLAVLDELFDQPDIDVLTCRHEGSAAFMAVADAKLTGRAGVCLVSRGPGAANASIAVHAAWQDATPLVLIVGHVRCEDIGREAFQEIDCARMFTGFVKASLSLHEPRHAAEFVARAFRIAESGTPGPVVLAIPENVTRQPDPNGSVATRWPESPSMPAPDGAGRLAELLAGARRPLLIAGGRLSSIAGREALRMVANRHGIPVVTSNKHQDLFDNRHPNYAGHLHNATPESQLTALDQADLILAVGTRLDETTTRRQRLPKGPTPNQPLVHVYPDATRLGLTHRPTLGIACDPVRFLDCVATLPPAGHPDRLMWTQRLHRIEELKSVWRPHAAPDGVVFGAVVTELDDLTGGEATVIVDSGTFTSWVYRYLRLTGSGRLLGLSSSPMGFGVPAGVAVACRRPGRPVVVIVGDGGFLMNGNELITAVAARLSLIIIVANNNSYATIRAHQERVYPGRCIATDLVNPDFARLAGAFGAAGVTVSAEHEIRPALRQALDCGGPILLDVRTSLTWITAYQRLGSAPTTPDGGGSAGRMPRVWETGLEPR
jgi:acetolactate synthase-1/2/3 large subunit